MAQIPDLDHHQNLVNWSLHKRLFLHQNLSQILGNFWHTVLINIQTDGAKKISFMSFSIKLLIESDKSEIMMSDTDSSLA